jgi:hypothetical protein
MTTEAELKRKVQVTLFLWEDGCIDKTDEEIAKAIHALYLEAGYVQLTRDEADLLLTCFKNESNRRYLKFSPDTEMEAKLRSRLEVKE